jgi:glycerol-3-phosphate dehydrogenase
MKLSDEQYAAIGQANGWSEEYAIEHGKRCYNSCREMILAEALAQPTREERRLFERGNTCLVRDLDDFLANRLKSLTQPPSKREKVEAKLEEFGIHRATLAAEIDAIYKESE